MNGLFHIFLIHPADADNSFAEVMKLIYTDEQNRCEPNDWHHGAGLHAESRWMFLSDEIKKISVRIGGMSYQLVTAENDLYTRQIAAKADEMIHRVLQNSPQLSVNMCTVLALVNAVDEMTGLYQKLSSIDGQKNETEKQAGEARKELMRLREQNWEMKKELLRLNDLCKEYQALINKLTTPEIAADQTEPAENEITPTPIETAAAAAETAPETTVPDTTAPAENRPENPPTVNPSLRQTDLDEYLRANGWPQTFENRKHDS
ncbi:MAG: cell division protein ZapA [Clostridiaceae bacterium]|nr:cell division protein ZapA [Clostridiaceae bacterium]